jgi:hypothetical protein
MGDKHKKPPVADGDRYNQIPTVAIKDALRNSFGIINLAAKTLGVTRQAIHARIQRNDELKQILEESKEYALDYAESGLMHNIGKKNQRAIEYYLDRKGKSRNYIKYEQVEHSGAVPVTLNEHKYDGEPADGE